MKTPVILFFLLLFIVSIAASCTSEGSGSEHAALPDGTLQEQVQFLVNQNLFDDALDLLRKEDETDRSILLMLRDTHLHYGNWLMYHAETIHMTDRMPKALQHFRRVLEMDPNNRTARSNIDQIETIYRQMGRDIPGGVAE
jgi:tetratricopeptide (TPR) repeat protein